MSILENKIDDEHYRQLITQYSASFSIAEHDLLTEILTQFEFDALQTQALVQAVLQQSRFNPNAQHIESEEDENTISVCQHCINPPMPPLRDYYIWRKQTFQAA